MTAHGPGRCTVRCPVGCLGLSARAYEPLRRERVCTIGELLALLAAGDLLEVRNIGRAKGAEIMRAVEAAGFSAGDQVLTAWVGVAAGPGRCGREACASAAVFTIEQAPAGDTRSVCAFHACTALLVLNVHGYRIKCSDEVYAAFPA